jgi:hypothetical protein
MSPGSLRASLVLVTTVTLAACNSAAPLPQGPDPLASLALPTVDGNTFDPGTLAGKVVVVNFWKPS